MVSGILAVLMVAAGPTGPDGPETAQRYKLDVSMTQEVDLTALGQGNQTSSIMGSVWFTLTMSDTTGGRLAHAVIDSMRIGTSEGQFQMSLSQTLADSLAGEFVHAYIKDGKVEGTATPSAPSNQATMLAVPVMNALFPGIRGGVSSWSDTTVTSTTSDDGNSMNSQAIADWTVVGMEGDAIKATATSSGTVSGSQGPQEISGEVANTFTVTSIAGGPASYAKMESDQNLLVIIPQAPEPLTVIAQTSAELTLIP